MRIRQISKEYLHLYLLILELHLKGITAHEIKAKVIVTIGANIKITLFELEGIITSLKIYFNASAKD